VARAVNKVTTLIWIALLLSACTPTNELDTDAVTSHLKSILEMPTFEHIYRDVIFLDRERSFLMFKTKDTEVLFAIDVRIQAGIDLKKGFAVTRSQSGAISVALPAAEILLADADESSIEQYFLKEVGGSISRLDYYDEIDRKKSALVNDSIDRGILERAEENARRLITSFLSRAGHEDVFFTEARGLKL
jgi:hypothetical protein